jgi:capsular polysaccharide biosynthesis protein
MMGDALPRVYVAWKRSLNFQLLLPAAYRRPPYEGASLGPSGLPPPTYLEDQQCVRVGTLELPGHSAPMGNYIDPVIRSVGHKLRQYFGGNTTLRRRIYVSRAKARYRRIVNEAEILPVLEKYRFEIVHMESMTFGEQVRLLSEAEILVSNHGAGLTNMLFMVPGAKVVEIRQTGDAHNNCYFTLASAMGLPYFYLLAPPTNPAESVHMADLVVNGGELASTLEQAVKWTTA